MKTEIIRTYYDSGNIKLEEYVEAHSIEYSTMMNDVKLHYREDGPSKIQYFDNPNIIEKEEYFIHGYRHNENGPAVIMYYVTGIVRRKEYWLNGQYNRENGPMFKNYYTNGLLESKIYYLNSEYHRLDGPAVTQYYDNGTVRDKYYFIEGVDVTKAYRIDPNIMHDKNLRKILM